MQKISMDSISYNSRFANSSQQQIEEPADDSDNEANADLEDDDSREGSIGGLNCSVLSRQLNTLNKNDIKLITGKKEGKGSQD